jgi:hypothetical protein
VSPQGQVNVDQLNKAIDQIVKDGSVAHIIHSYSNGLK